MRDISAVLGNVQEFLAQIFSELQQLGVDVAQFELDHLCYRVASCEQYEVKKAQMSEQAVLLSEAKIAGRYIATFELMQPIKYAGRSIAVVEVPQPKIGVETVQGLEHIEFVIAENFHDFIARYPELNFDMSGLTKQHNPELLLRLSQAQVKFHHVALKALIKQEARILI